MKGLLLIGGFGTRLRPLTLSCSKPCIEFCNKQVLLYQIEALHRVGVVRIVLAVGKVPQDLADNVQEWRERYSIDIVFSIEHEPLGTAGPLALAQPLLNEDLPGEEHPDLVFMFNSDVLCTFPLSDLLSFHTSHGGEGTIMGHSVEDPSRFGVIIHEADGHISSFVEKPQTFVGREINAGLYLLNRSVARRVPDGVRTSIEREVFPAMARDGALYCAPLEGFWMDVGKPDDFISGGRIMLNHLHSTGELQPAQIDGVEVIGHIAVSPSATVAAGCRIGPNVTIGPGCIVGPSVRLSDTVLLKGVSVAQGGVVQGSIVGWGGAIGAWGRVEGSVLGEGVTVADDVVVTNCKVLPNVELKAKVSDKVILC